MSDAFNVEFVVSPSPPLAGRFPVAGDKSISHRAVMLGAIAEGVTEIEGLLEGEDVLATVAAMRAMGVRIEGPSGGAARIHGVGLKGLTAPQGPLDMGNSGTAMRLLSGLLAGQSFAAELVGDESLMRRPMERVAAPLRDMGARVTTRDGKPPVSIEPAPDGLHGVVHHLQVASAQLKSALLLAGLYARGETRVLEPAVTRDHTERMLEGFGCRLHRGEDWVAVGGGQVLEATAIKVPGDISSAAFFLVGAAMRPGAEVIVEGVGVNPSRTGILNVLERMGAPIDRLDERIVAGEPVADLRVRGGVLTGIEVATEWVSLAIDEFPAICIAAAAATGETTIRGASELRVKESDRIAAMATGLRRLGIDVTEFDDGMAIRGGPIAGGSVDSRSDHRIAMAFAVAGASATGAVRIADCRNVATSFPDFVEVATAAGIRIEENLSAGPA